MDAQIERAFDVPKDTFDGLEMRCPRFANKPREIPHSVCKIGLGGNNGVHEGADHRMIHRVVGFIGVDLGQQLEVGLHWRFAGIAIGHAKTSQHVDKVLALQEGDPAIIMPDNLNP
ncbi:BQ5605_C011g06541 [Microbotryum silenes-dioicae]|uniref:BQ5605_C011g06541 protein n=1 Tax=Microbotryum silenes-dioicae TaxID=796604 RepID=A0A2X0LSP4_9BASI|nr:BQ5605_C011g06541 [Microbotryum silenes-dioicae]